ncbi:response regulator [Chitinasiproducens palmae]|uniref:Two component transcriptional regulator, winged helix family n=1 Tax=Chitinasiproducens palmae TaxID=1770053 RepID=A0A1H2PWA6_9BURK|nr:response regulator [Chitinasiproducens palmae]SDV51621.1 two component transcriptional regulator, winged helix family [Chitinasiproducens palmae]
MRVLLIEDDEMIAAGVTKALRADGWAVDWAADGASGANNAANAIYDIVLLDLGLPRRDGLEVLGGMRRAGVTTPVLILTARDAVADRVKGLNAGADDYLVKPFDLDELAARMRALTRRHAGRGEATLRVGRLTIDTSSRAVTCDGSEVVLSAREYTLLEALASRPGAVLSKAQLEDKIYGWGEEVGSNTIEVYVHALRKKLGADVIRTVRGLGYAMARPETATADDTQRGRGPSA